MGVATAASFLAALVTTAAAVAEEVTLIVLCGSLAPAAAEVEKDSGRAEET